MSIQINNIAIFSLNNFFYDIKHFSEVTLSFKSQYVCFCFNKEIKNSAKDLIDQKRLIIMLQNISVSNSVLSNVLFIKES